MADNTDPKQQTMTVERVGRKVDTLSHHMDDSFDDARERDRKDSIDTRQQDNGRITMALLGLKIDNMSDKMDAGFKDSKEDVASLCERWEEGQEDHEDRLRVVETTIIDVKARVTILAGLQAAFTAGAAILAAWFGGKS